MKKKWQKLVAPLMAAMLMVGILANVQPPVYAAEGSSIAAPLPVATPAGVPTEATAQPDSNPALPDSSSVTASQGDSAAAENPAQSEEKPAGSALPSSAPSSGAASSPSHSVSASTSGAASASSSSVSAASSAVSATTSSELTPSSSSAIASAPTDLEAWLSELVLLARSDAAAAAKTLQAQTDQDAFEKGLKAVLDLYYGEGLEELLGAFSAELGERAAEILAAYAKAAAERATALEQGFIPGEVIVIFEPGVGEVQAEAVTAEHEAALTATVDTPEPEVYAVAELPLDQTVEEAVTSLAADPSVQYAQPNYLYTTEALPAPNDTGKGNLWYTGSAKVDVLGAWELLQNAGLNPAQNQVRVAVLDTAIMASHPDLQANLDTAGGLWDFQNSRNTGGVRGMPSSFDGAVGGDFSHGTHVTGIIGATANNGTGIYGVASGMANNYIRLSAYNVFSTTSSRGRYEAASSLDVANAMNHAVNSGAKVINMSLGYLGSNPTSEDLLMKSAMQNAWNQDVVVVTSAGNNGSQNPHIPGSFGLSIDVINLQNTDYANHSINPRSSTSNYGSTKTISAPGSNIYSTIGASGAASYGYLSGTSMAAPIVTGVVSLMRYANPGLTVAQIHQILKETAIDTYTPGFDVETAWGCVNAKAAVQRALAQRSSGWVQKSDGLYYYYGNGAPATGWQTIGGGTYYFSATGRASVGLCSIGGGNYYFAADGKMQTGWVSTGGYTYYMDTGGRAHTGWLSYGGYLYYMNGSGQVVTGLQNIGGLLYYMDGSGRVMSGWLLDAYGYRYFNPGDGHMLTGRAQANGSWYLFDANGYMRGGNGWIHDGSGWLWINPDGHLTTGWIIDNGGWYYLNPNDGARMATGWALTGTGWYYMNGAGQMQTGWLKEGNSWYYLNGSGQMQTGWMNDGGTWYYFDPNNGGRMATGWASTGSGWYYLNGAGQMQTGWLWAGDGWYYLNGAGQMQTGWLYAGGSWYYLDNSGRMTTGWCWVNGQWYWMHPGGQMATGDLVVDGSLNRFSANGAWLGAV